MTTSPAPIPHNIYPMTFEETVLIRHSTRRFLPQPVPKQILHHALSLATHAPSNSNIQPWRFYLLSGAAADRLKTALVAEASSGAEPLIPPLPDDCKHFRSELGKQVYGEGGLGIARDDIEGRRAAVLRNFDFFGAPTAAIVCMNNTLSKADAVSVGMYLQTFLLSLTEAQVGSCVEVSVAGYPDVIRKCLSIPEDMDIICGVAIGYEDESMVVNRLRSRRVSVEETTVILED
ncbi:hypothetical protein GYMLUDRAFT_49369 [Collybiopsis luxurians FD-317 M1]|uniref:Nitroreductase domain-containing protein n=1 Tax=Collybiopsis luxurians FD-317 M1 TaxID=944289 RepID=A0A0D0C686_9AGAR|nr:hypothetical protein GYMLUDRAFT_49369 [Collybiopsis luxurians FD-317 M1]